MTHEKTARFCRAVFLFQKSACYSPPPKRRDHQPALRGWVSSVVVPPAAGSAAAGADGSGWLWWTGAASGWALTRKLTFSRTVERRRAARSAS
jgi:hypothetical protein